MANNPHAKMLSTSFITRKMQTGARMRQYNTPTRMTEVTKTSTYHIGKDVEQLELLYTTSRNAKW